MTARWRPPFRYSFLMLAALILATLSILFPSAASADKIPLRIASIDWCPQLCPEGEQEGYIMDTVRALFKDSPYQLEIREYPWSRAIGYTRTGRVHALLSPARAEAPDLVFPDQEIGSQRMCFFVLKENPWQFTGPPSLSGHLTGIASDTSIEELNAFITDNQHLFNYSTYGPSYLRNSLNLLKFSRVNSFLFTYNSTIHAARQFGMADRIRSAGCVSLAKVYMAFSPAPELTVEVTEMKRFFDARMTQFRAEGKVAGIMARYGLPDWTTLTSDQKAVY